ncbi:MAG: RluA family pseudouridine synthase [Kiritimatiellae bacterium]|nr:RluA family pseudouridine synthase [Kiritimatiellia bacterium]
MKDDAVDADECQAEVLPESEVFTLTIEGGADARRLDQWLVGKLPELTRSRIQALAKAGHLTDSEGRTITKLSVAPQPGMILNLTLPPAEPVDIIPEAIPLNILYEDADLIALNKPAGLVVHPACGHSHGTLVNALLYHCPDLKGIGGEKRPGIVHRLDMDTSGVMVVAKHERALHALVETFSTHNLTKEYIAIVHGEPKPEGTLDNLIGRSSFHRQKMAVVPVNGRRAITHWKRLATLPNGLSRVLCRIETGRTHQIRVHLASCGTPIVGDALYGKPALDHRLPHPPARQLLHALHLELPHPMTGAKLSFTAEPPEDFAPYLA